MLQKCFCLTHEHNTMHPHGYNTLPGHPGSSNRFWAMHYQRTRQHTHHHQQQQPAPGSGPDVIVLD
jgi:hypothetical protein